MSTTEREGADVSSGVDAVEPVIQKLGAFKFNSGMSLQNATQALTLSGPKPQINFKFNVQSKPNSTTTTGGGGVPSVSFNLPPKPNNQEASGD